MGLGNSAERDRRARKEAAWAVVVGLILIIVVHLAFQDRTPGQKQWKELKHRLEMPTAMDGEATE